MKKIIIGFFIFTAQLLAITFTSDTNLTQDEVYNDVNVSACILNLNGHTLTINGNMVVSGDNARLKMTNTSDKLIVTGDLTFEGASTYKDYLTKGVIELQGNFYQKGVNAYSDSYGSDNTNNAYSFYPKGTHKVILNGTTQQTVSFEAASNSRFNNLEIQNSAGVVFDQLSVIGELTRNTYPITVTDIRYLTLNEDFIIANNLTVGRVLNLNGHTLTVNGNMVVSGDNARLKMTNTSDKLIVTGDLTFEGASTYKDYLTKGVIELQGNFYQKGVNAYSDSYGSDNTNNAYSFYPKGTHKVILNGTTQQTVSFEAASNSRFNNLEIQNSAGVVFDQNTSAVGTLFTTPELYNSTYKNSTTLTYAKYLDSNYDYLDIKAGMNLIALPNTSDLQASQLSSVFGSDITTVWTFKDNAWNGFSTMSEKMNTLADQNLSTISSISHGEGIIVNSLVDQTLLFPKGQEYSIKDLNVVENLSSGWHLLGTNKSISLTEIKLLNPNIVSLWSYDTTKWFADASEEEFINNINAREITPLVNVQANSAFWAYVK